MRVKVICIDDRHRPNEVPTGRWVKKDSVYHITEVAKLNAQQGVYGCKLAEINNDDLFPYQFFRLDRFAPVIDSQDLEDATLEEISLSDLDEVLQPEPVPVPAENS